MNIEPLLASSIDGLMVGIIYGLAAMGLTLIFGVMRVINLAHGPVIAMGMYAILVLTTSLGLNPYLSLIITIILGLLVGIVMYFVAISRVINAPELTTLLATYSVNLMVIGVATVVFTTTPRAVDINLGAIRQGAITILGTKLVAVLIAIAV